MRSCAKWWEKAQLDIFQDFKIIELFQLLETIPAKDSKGKEKLSSIEM